MRTRTRTTSTWALLVVGALILAGCSGAKKEDTSSGGNVSAGTSDTTIAAGAEAADGSAPVDGVAPVAGPGSAGTGGAKAGTATARGGSGSATSAGVAGGPGFTPSTLFRDNENTIGITKTSITMCAHAALTYGPAFNTSADDLNVFWTALSEEKGGVHGRKVVVTYENDDYKPETAVQAATACKAKNPFFLLGGIGFDQIPAVRNWAEQNRMLYIHHTATVNGAQGKQFSFAPLPSTEKMGEMFGELVVKRFKDKKIGIIKRASENWEPGVVAFKALAKKHGINIVEERPVQNAQGNYTTEILAMKNAGAEVVFGWENALAATELVKQAKAQQYSPTWLLFPFNLTSQTLDDEALSPKMVGIAMFPAYSKGDYSGKFSPYADDMKEFERQYAKYKPNVDLGGVAGDLLFLNWTAQKATYVMLDRCGPDCTRNKFIDVMRTFNAVPTSSGCALDFTRGNEHQGGHAVNIMETYRASGGKVNWRNTDFCVEHLL